MRSRNEQIAAFYDLEAANLRRTVDCSVYAPVPVVEDACQHAWCQLVAHDEIRLDRGGFWWLYRVATRKAWDLTRRRAVILSLDAPITADGETVAEVLAGPDDVARAAEERELIALLDQLPERERRAMFLQVVGFSISEISRMTGDSDQTVMRLTGRGRRRLRNLRRGVRVRYPW
jgi:RNA polymerase sigma-70 factor (ECF subfamily)